MVYNKTGDKSARPTEKRSEVDLEAAAEGAGYAGNEDVVVGNEPSGAIDTKSVETIVDRFRKSQGADGQDFGIG